MKKMIASLLVVMTFPRLGEAGVDAIPWQVITRSDVVAAGRLTVPIEQIREAARAPRESKFGSEKWWVPLAHWWNELSTMNLDRL
jgi:hypothetical protein